MAYTPRLRIILSSAVIFLACVGKNPERSAEAGVRSGDETTKTDTLTDDDGHASTASHDLADDSDFHPDDSTTLESALPGSLEEITSDADRAAELDASTENEDADNEDGNAAIPPPTAVLFTYKAVKSKLFGSSCSACHNTR